MDRINAALFRRMERGRAQMTADADGITNHGQRYLYSDLERAVAYCQPNVVGDDMVILLDFGRGRVIGVSEHDKAWKAIVAALDAHPRNRTRYPAWSVGLVADVSARFELLWPVGHAR